VCVVVGGLCGSKADRERDEEDAGTPSHVPTSVSHEWCSRSLSLQKGRR